MKAEQNGAANNMTTKQLCITCEIHSHYKNIYLTAREKSLCITFVLHFEYKIG